MPVSLLPVSMFLLNSAYAISTVRAQNRNLDPRSDEQNTEI